MPHQSVLLEIPEEESALVKILNRYSVFFHALLSCGVIFLIEWMSRHSFAEAVGFVTGRPLVFLYNALIIFISLMFVYLFKRRMEMRMVICTFWLLLGTINGCVLLKRVSPFGFTDLKMINDLFTMESNYFSDTEAALAILLISAIVVFLIVFWVRGPKFTGALHRLPDTFILAAMLLLFPKVTNAAVSNHILAEYFENLAQGYKDYGFIYSFSASVMDRGMHTPESYSEEAVESALAHIRMEEDIAVLPESDEDEPEASAGIVPHTMTKTASASVETDIPTEPVTAGSPADPEEMPNIICVLLESFVDPTEINFLELSEDPVPYFHLLYDTYSSGYLTVPVVGAGTANTEFEVLTGMSMQYFGLGEYPYKTILKKTNCESIAADLADLGYGTHVVHNNGGNFYSRREIFSQMGFDTFTSKEMMDIREYTPLGTWPTDHILVGEVKKALDLTPDQSDFVYTITVQGHGEYPEEKVIEDPDITVSGSGEEAKDNQWEYYVNMIHEMDQFINELVTMLENRDEKTIVVLFGDHLPTMGLSEEDMASGSIFKTKYVSWNNFGVEKKTSDITSYQLMAEILDQIGYHIGTMFRFHQKRDTYVSDEEYKEDLELLQYDILYGNHYVYGGGNPYPATDLVMGTQDIILNRIAKGVQYAFVIGKNFTRWSKVYINDEKISTKYLSSHMLRIKAEKLKEGENSVVVNQVGSSSTIFRSSNELVYTVLPETEPQTEKQTEKQTQAQPGISR